MGLLATVEGAVMTQGSLLQEASKGRTHFIGIGGVGMSVVAMHMAERGFEVSGSDSRTGLPVYDDLLSKGVRISAGRQEAANVDGAKLVIVSAGIPETNKELLRAREVGLPLALKTRLQCETLQWFKNSIAVTGTHGKTTTTALISRMFLEAGINPSVSCQDAFAPLNSYYNLASDEFFVVELTEMDGWFAEASPSVGLITNASAEHLNLYEDEQGVKCAFGEFIDNTLSSGGTIVGCANDENLKSILPSHDHVITYGLDKGDVRGNAFLDGTMWDLTVTYRDRVRVRCKTPLRGRHLVEDLVGAIAVVLNFDVPPKAIQAAVRDFQGVNRRYELGGYLDGVPVIIDMAEHPTELSVSISSTTEYGFGRIGVIFAPPKLCWDDDDFARVLSKAARVVLVGSGKDDDSANRILKHILKDFHHKDAQTTPLDEIPDNMSRLSRDCDVIVVSGLSRELHSMARSLCRLET
ncbi:MAG: Mur ligase family protein [Thermoleophilia bacterium]